MSFTTKALLHGDTGGFYSVLRQFLLNMGIRGAVLTNKEDLQSFIEEDVWPIVFIARPEGDPFDAFLAFEQFYAQPGAELLNFVFVTSPDDKRILIHSRSVGAKGYIRRPLQPIEAQTFLRELTPPENDPWIRLAIRTSRTLFTGDYDQARPALKKLAENPAFHQSATIALLRIDTTLGSFSQGEERLGALIRTYPQSLRVLCEGFDYFRKTSQVRRALRFGRLIQQNSHLPLRAWEQATLCIEADEFDLLAETLDELNKVPELREHGTEALCRVMQCLGLGDHIPQVARPFPQVLRQYAAFQNLQKAKAKG